MEAYDLTEEEKRDRAEAIKAQKLTDIQVRTAMKDPNTRIFIWKIIGECGIFHDVEGLDANEAFKFLGKRGIGLVILDMLNQADPAIFTILMKENSKNDNINR